MADAGAGVLGACSSSGEVSGSFRGCKGCSGRRQGCLSSRGGARGASDALALRDRAERREQVRRRPAGEEHVEHLMLPPVGEDDDGTRRCAARSSRCHGDRVRTRASAEEDDDAEASVFDPTTDVRPRRHGHAQTPTARWRSNGWQRAPPQRVARCS